MTTPLTAEDRNELSLVPITTMIFKPTIGELHYLHFFIEEELGYSLAQFKDAAPFYLDLLHPDDLLLLKEKEQELLKNHLQFSKFSTPIRIRALNGDFVLFQFTETLISSSNEAETLLITLQNLQKARYYENALRESEQRFKALSEASFGGIGIHDKGLIIEANSQLSVFTKFWRYE